MTAAPGSSSRRLWAPSAWLGGRWIEGVVLEFDAQGCWAAITPGWPPPEGCTVLEGPALPGLVNAHSHAFQRAFVGQAESRANEHDDFWSWRDRMYGVALSITPAGLREVATRLYGELLQGGYTHVCEFHYLHHDHDGRPYANPLAMGEALAQAAATTGIGLTILPVLYERAGFMQPALRDDQRRFRTEVASVLALRDGIRAAAWPGVDAGVAIHSLRAAAPASIHALRQALENDVAPIHIHVAEQTAEVDDCLAATGKRPIEWLAHQGLLDARWQLVHATHATPQEIEAVAASGAGIVLCPTTEANLGDGIPDLPRWLEAGLEPAIGSDSHVTRDAAEELRWLEYAQRLVRRQRNVAALPGRLPSTAARLFEAALHGGGRAAGMARSGFVPGARADLLVLGRGAATAPPEHALDAWVFSSPRPALARIMVRGRWVSMPA
jgi:formimidoylglutamate deiminase